MWMASEGAKYPSCDILQRMRTGLDKLSGWAAARRPASWYGPCRGSVELMAKKAVTGG